MVDAPSSTSTSRPDKPLRVALAHDWLCGIRGGEHVLERIARLIVAEHEPAGLYTMFDDGRPIGPAVDAMPKHVARLGRKPWSNALRRWLLPMYPGAVGELSARLAHDHESNPIDLLISTSSAAIKGLRAPVGVPHLCYCHSPARYVWSQQSQYHSGLRGVGLTLMGGRFREWDRATAVNVTRFLANSRHTASEIARCYGRDSIVIHPPVRDFFFEEGLEERSSIGTSAPWLVVSALEPYKRVDLAIAAANRANHALIVVGAGSQLSKLKAMAGPTVTFLGRIGDDDLRKQYRQAAILLFPQVEDFGIVALEAQASGLPVVARGAGGALDTVIEANGPMKSKATGALFPDNTVESLLEAIARCPRNAQACRDNANRFSEAAFDQRMREQIASVTRA